MIRKLLLWFLFHLPRKESALRDCPFCGFQAFMQHDTRNGTYFVTCGNLDCYTNQTSRTESKAAELWEKRV